MKMVMRENVSVKILSAAIAGIACFFPAGAQEKATPAGSLAAAEYGFDNPQDSARTKVWWFHGKYAASRSGMTADLEAFKNAGIGGVVIYDQVHGDTEPGTPCAMDSVWWEDVRYAVREAERIGLTVEFHVGNGYVAGGPWIEPRDAMKKVAVTDTVVAGGKRIEMTLPQPRNKYGFAKDIRLLAFPSKDDAGVSPTYSSNVPGLNAGRLFKGENMYEINATGDTAVYIYVDYGKAVTLRSVSYLTGPDGKATTSATNVPGEPGTVFVGTGFTVLPPIGVLQWSEDGEVYSDVCVLKHLYHALETSKRKTIAFLPVTARFFRLKLSEWHGADEGKALKIGGVRLSADPMVNEYEYKAAYISEYIEPSMASPCYDDDDIIGAEEVVDITDCLGDDGIVRWDAPEGSWRVLRVCMVATGGHVKHGRPDMMGLECDKMSESAARLQFEAYFARIADSLAAWHVSNLAGMVMDSHEAGSQNWTDDFLEAFEELRGYDLTTYLPVVAGYMIDDVKTSEGVLYDMRRTIADLISQRYYGTFESLCRKRGLVLTAQATGNGQSIVAVPIEAKGRVGKPQGEFWWYHYDGNYDIKEASSAAHLYGKTVASAEAFTDGGVTVMPSDLKNIGDAAYAFGINEFVVCASAHQRDSLPGGDIAGRCYATYTRNNTWWSCSRDFWDWQARVSYVLRQGRPVADLCVFLGNNAPTRILTHRLPKVPAGYDFDAFTEEALLSRMEVTDGMITLPTGQQYAMMVLPRSGELSLDALRKIAAMVRAGARVYGNRPTGSPAKADVGKEEEYASLVSALWDGDGRVFSGMPLAEALQQAGIRPDVDGHRLYFAHRETADCDIYFLNNHSDDSVDGTFAFRSGYRNAYLWDAVAGVRYSLSSDSGNVDLTFAPRESYFVVFTDKDESLDPLPQPANEKTLDGGWTVTFNDGTGDDGTVMQCRDLDYWNNSDNDSIRYFSGTAAYRTSFDWDIDSVGAVFLTLLPNRCVTTVYVNGIRAGSIWAAPWRADIAKLLHRGNNDIELRVTNSWNNHAVYDLGQTEDARLIKHPEWFVNENTTLENAGLRGAVSLVW